MDIFFHHIYEYEKGIRNLVLFTTSLDNLDVLQNKLTRKQIPFMVLPVGKNKINVFFGNSECISIIKSIGKLSLTEYTAEEDFMLGIMLGYDIKKQCERFIQFKAKSKNKAKNLIA